MFKSAMLDITWPKSKCQTHHSFMQKTFCGATDTCFGLLVTFPLGFKARVCRLIHTWLWHTCYRRFTSDATSADLLVASMAAKPFSSTYLQAGIGGVQNWDLSYHHSQCEIRQTLYQMSYADSAFIEKNF